LPLPTQEPQTQKDLLANAAREARARGLDDYFIVDADFHQNEHNAWAEILEFFDNDVLRDFFSAGGKDRAWIPASVQNAAIQDVAGRIQVQQVLNKELIGQGSEREVESIRTTMDMLGTDYTLLFPTELLHFGTNPYVELEAPLAHAYARWMSERILAREPRIITMLYLPFNDPDASLEIVERYADTPGVVGFMVTSVRYRPVHDRQYMKVYAAIQERDMALGFHTAFHSYERSMEQLNKFLSAHTLAFPHYQMVQLTNWVINGMPERFPALKVVFVEGGLAMLPYLMERLDHEYRMRVSEAPLLRRLPSEYMREMYYTSQPMESFSNPSYLETTFDMINASSQLLYASDWPHWDFDLPSRVVDLPFLGEDEKRAILGENSRRVFGLPRDAEPRAVDLDGRSSVSA
jgi:predicted TIM-barrel fold metal-dependent hydrolase